MIIDFHAHPHLGQGILERMVQVCDEAGVDMMCLSGAGKAWGCYDNDGIERAFNKYPDRFVGFGYIDLGKDTPEVIDEFHARGFKGLKTQNPPSCYSDERFYGFYERAQERQMPFLFHTGIGARCPDASEEKRVATSSEYMRPVLLDGVARAFPELTIVMAHLGFPWCMEAAFLTITHPNIYTDLAGIDRSETTYPSVVNFKELFSWHPNSFKKVLFGTEGGPANIKWVKEETEEMLRRHEAKADVIKGVMGETARRLLSI